MDGFNSVQNKGKWLDFSAKNNQKTLLFATVGFPNFFSFKLSEPEAAKILTWNMVGQERSPLRTGAPRSWRRSSRRRRTLPGPWWSRRAGCPPCWSNIIYHHHHHHHPSSLTIVHHHHPSPLLIIIIAHSHPSSPSSSLSPQSQP